MTRAEIIALIDRRIDSVIGRALRELPAGDPGFGGVPTPDLVPALDFHDSRPIAASVEHHPV
jgi:hypothetical protein